MVEEAIVSDHVDEQSCCIVLQVTLILGLSGFTVKPVLLRCEKDKSTCLVLKEALALGYSVHSFCGIFTVLPVFPVCVTFVMYPFCCTG